MVKEGGCVKGFDDLEECHCDCHKEGSTVMHCKPCCFICENCGRRIKSCCYYSHKDKCKFDCICECHTKDGGKPQENCNGYKCDCGKDNILSILSLEEMIQEGLKKKEDKNDEKK